MDAPRTLPGSIDTRASRRLQRRSVRSLVALLALLSVGASPALAEDTPRELSFAAFFRQPVGPRGLELSQTLRDADGRRVRLVGHIVVREEPQPGRFQLTPRPVRMSEHADGDADDLPPAAVTVLLDPSQHDRVVAQAAGPVALTGRLSVGREEDAEGHVSWVRLQLDPDAVAAGTRAAPAEPGLPGPSLTPPTPPP